jgi:flagellum-specific ATP synthase
VADAARAILDGHIVLSRPLAESGLYPAIDIEASASRVMHNIVSAEHWALARRFRQLYARYQKSRDLIQLGAYVAGSDPETDLAIQLHPAMQALLAQDMRECAPFAESVQRLAQVLANHPAGGSR